MYSSDSLKNRFQAAESSCGKERGNKSRTHHIRLKNLPKSIPNIEKVFRVFFLLPESCKSLGVIAKMRPSATAPGQ